jgi:hypothetical protein
LKTAVTKVFDPHQRQTLKMSSTQLNAVELPRAREPRGFAVRQLALRGFPA